MSKLNVDVENSGKRILFLSINTDGKDVRDGYTYNFVSKEMERLAQRGESVYFFSLALNDIDIDKGIVYDGGRFMRQVSVWQLLVLLFSWPKLSLSAMVLDWRRTLWLLKVDRAIYNMAKHYNINVIHTHFFFPSGMAGVAAAASLKIPLIATLRGAELHNRPELEYGACRDPLFRCLLQFSIPYCNRVTAPNLCLVDRLINEWGTEKDKVEYLPNGVDIKLPSISRKKNKVEGNPIKLIAVGRLIRLKDHLTIIKAVEQAGRYVSREIQLTIVGNGPLAKEIKHYLFENKCTGIRILDEISKVQLFELMQEHNVLLHSSIVEGMPNVILEALSLGIPCVASDISGHREIIQQGVNGYLFPVSSVVHLTEILVNLTMYPQKIVSMAASSVASIDKFLLDKKISRYQELYCFDYGY